MPAKATGFGARIEVTGSNLVDVLGYPNQPMRVHSELAALNQVTRDDVRMAWQRTALAKEPRHERVRITRSHSQHHRARHPCALTAFNPRLRQDRPTQRLVQGRST